MTAQTIPVAVQRLQPGPKAEGGFRRCTGVMRKWTALLAIACARLCPAAASLHGVLAPSFERHPGESSGEERFVVRTPGYAAVFDSAGAAFYDGTPGENSASVQLLLAEG